METVTVSQKFQVVLPKLIRRGMEIMPGERLVVLEKNGIIEMVPIGKLKDARGIAKGADTKGLRDESERFA